MFQNINVEYEDNTEYDDIKVNKKEIIINKLKEIFKIRNIIYYIICFGASMIGFGDGISPFRISTFSCNM